MIVIRYIRHGRIHLETWEHFADALSRVKTLASAGVQWMEAK